MCPEEPSLAAVEEWVRMEQNPFLQDRLRILSSVAAWSLSQILKCIHMCSFGVLEYFPNLLAIVLWLEQEKTNFPILHPDSLIWGFKKFSNPIHHNYRQFRSTVQLIAGK